MAVKSPFWLKPAAALKYWRNKGVRIVDAAFRKLSAQTKDQAFYVSRLTEIRSVISVRNAIDKALDGGLSFAQTKDTLIGLLSQEKTKSAANVGAARRLQRDIGRIFSGGLLKTVFRTNIMSAYGAGHRQALDEAIADGRERVVMYDAIDDERTRPHHAALDNLVRPASDPIWKRIWPPNGFNCRCRAISMPPAVARSRKIKVTDPKQMRKMLGDKFPDPGFDHAPGRNVFGQKTLEAVSKLRSPKARIKRWRKVQPGLQPVVEQDWREFVDAMAVGGHNKSGRRLAQRYIGMITRKDASVGGLILKASDADLKQAYRKLRQNHGVVDVDARKRLLAGAPKAVAAPGAEMYKTTKRVIVPTGEKDMWFNFDAEGGSLLGIEKIEKVHAEWKKIEEAAK